MLDAFTWYKQAAFRWSGFGRTVYFDPWGIDEGEPPADLVLISHGHYDHFDLDDLARISTDGTHVVAPPDVAGQVSGAVTPVQPGDAIEVAGIKIQVVPAYNVVEERLGFHPRSDGGVGYLVELAGKTVYHAGDTDHTEEAEAVRTDLALLPAGGTYTMDANEAAGLARAMAPSLAVPMHYGFICGSPEDGETFRSACAPEVPVEVLAPVRPWGEGPVD